MIVNILDLREAPYRWKAVLAVVEAAVKNNSAEGADKVENNIGVEIDYAEREDLTVREAILWADGLAGKVTLYLYDKDGECTDKTTG